MTRPMVSCIVPCFNGARFLGDCLHSILAQTHRPLEIIVVDDGSTDASPAIVAQFGGAVRYHRRTNGGPAAACNSGVTLATCEYIAFLEQDDLWLDRKIACQLAALETRPGAGYCVAHIQNFWEPSLADDELRYRAHPVMQPRPGYVVQTLLARRRAFEQVGPFDEALQFAAAADWFARAEEAGCEGVLLPDVLTRRRLHEDNFSRRHRQASRDQFVGVVKAALDRRRRRAPEGKA